MKQQVLKAIANPAHIFYVPYSLAVLNFLIQFVVFCVIFVVVLLVYKKDINPIFFLLSVMFVHSIIAIFSKRDPQLGQIITSKLNLFSKRIPRKLSA
jgi:type IV secretory pathway VirB3-like protein